MNQIENLMALRNKLANGKMSLLVGAGFSKNVSKEFPDWVQLLQDLVYEMYDDEIESKINAGISEEQRKQALRMQTQKIVERLGYLKVVSEYITRKGYEEAIVTYIEKHTPIEKAEDGAYYLINKDGTKELLTDAKLHLHKLLLSFPWNNVFTTNYDPLLEASVDIDLHAKLQHDNNLLSERINQLTREIKKAKAEEEEIDRKLNESDNSINAVIAPAFPIEGASSSEDFRKERDRLSGRLSEIMNQIDLHESEKYLKQQKFTINEEQANNCYTVVTCGAELSLKRNRNIIKLHGSLRSIEDRSNYQFGFDNDSRKQYIISAEHYEQYPHKHEAFTQLMRIALLQESFCLIGFSGVDPNFTAWIGWVRDLLYKSAQFQGKQSDYKIYLIEMSENGSKVEDRQLYYENHRIGKIALLSSGVIEFLEKETGRSLNKDDKYGSALELLFDFFASHDSILISVKRKDPGIEEEWQSLWRNIEKLEDDKLKIIEQKVVANAEIVSSLANKIAIPNLSINSAHEQYSFFNLFHKHRLSELSSNGRESIFKLLISLVNKLFIPIRSVVGQEVIDELLAMESLKREAADILERDAILRDPPSSESADALNKILQFAFILDFDGLAEYLDQWHPSIREMHIKAGFLSQFDRDKAIQLLETQVMSNLIDDQQRVFSLELLLCIKWGKSWSKDEKLRDQIEQYKKAGYFSFIELIDQLADSLDVKPPSTVPYGRGRFSVSDDRSFISPLHRLPPLQILTLIVNYGFPIQTGNLWVIKKEIWYKVFKAGFEEFPFPFLYYALQYNNENIQRRMAQDIASSSKIGDQKLPIIKSLFRAFSRYDKAIIFLSELFISIPSVYWEDDFAASWKTLAENGAAFDRFNTACDSYINAGLKYVENPEIIYMIVAEMLTKEEQHTDRVVSYLYYLNSNRFFTKVKRDKIPNNLGSRIDVTINRLGVKSLSPLFTLGNIFFLLSEEQLNRIYEILKEADFSLVNNSRLLRTALFFSKHDLTITEKIRKAVLGHSELWATGIVGKTIRGGQQTLPIMEFTTRANPIYGIQFDSQDLKIIYDGLKSSLTEIQKMKSTRRLSLFNFTEILFGMRRFLNYFKNDLAVYSDFTDTLKTVDGIYALDTGFSDYREGLSSTQKSSVVWALSELSDQIEFERFDDEGVNLVLNKLLLQAQPALEACLSYVATWISDDKKLPFFKEHSTTLVRILKKYKDHPLPERDVSFIEEKLVRIAFALRRLGLEDPAIAATLDLKNIAFNNTRQWLISKESEPLTSVQEEVEA